MGNPHYKHKNPPKLSDRHRIVIAEYFANGGNKKVALEAAGYAASTIEHSEHQVFKHPAVAAEIERRQRILAEKSEVKAEWVISKLKELAQASLEPFLRRSDDGGLYFDFTEATPDELARLEEVVTETYVIGRGDSAKQVLKTKIKLSNRLAALDKLARHLGLFKDRLELDASDELVQRLAAARKRIGPKKGENDGSA